MLKQNRMAMFVLKMRVETIIYILLAGQNTRSDVIRQATIYAFAKTAESVPDEVVKRDPSGDLWRDWSDEVRSIEHDAR